VEAAAAAYAAELGDTRFTVTILGVGPDGHVASLFPGRPEIERYGRGALPVRNSPKPPPLRVSLTRDSLCHTDELWFVVAGADKATKVAEAMRPGAMPLPAARVRGASTIWLLDAEAASAL